jgi:hypothetical protein
VYRYNDLTGVKILPMIKLPHRYNLLLLFCSLVLVFLFGLTSSANVRDVDLEMGPALNPEPGIRYVNYNINRINRYDVIRVNVQEEQPVIQAKQLYFGSFISAFVLYPSAMWDYISSDSIFFRACCAAGIFWCFPLYLGYYVSFSWPEGTLFPTNFEYKRWRVERDATLVSELKWVCLAVSWIVEIFCFMPHYAYHSIQDVVPHRYFFYILYAILITYVLIPTSCFSCCYAMQHIVPE